MDSQTDIPFCPNDLDKPVAGSEPATATRPGRCSRAVVNFYLDVLLGLIFTAMLAITGVIRFVFPAPTLAAGWKLWGLTLDDWSQLQFVVMAIFGAGVVLHVMLHWTWVCGMLTRGRAQSSLRTDNGIQTLVGVAVLAVMLHVIGLLVLAGMLTVQKS